MHFCQNEMFALMMAVPGIMWMWFKVKMLWAQCTRKAAPSQEDARAVVHKREEDG